ncbi:minor capsid protein [Corallococcus sp. bb12-1]|uniref:minor capsid protein n=1 Tax=Corallococcus sp. bb12-1 TaxID=2996784 RepID=UPI00226E239E|nr:minor capsid protein [Corallococcus sp. bb12-1]MCY1042721.1 minor capsid protein [Corallococcus sp. bb12-1]
MSTSLPTVSEALLERSVMHAVQLERYKAGVARRVVGLLNDTEERLTEQLAARLQAIEDAGGYDAGRETTERIAGLLSEVRVLRAGAYAAAAGVLAEEAAAFATYEARWQAALLEEVLIVDISIAAPTAEVLEAAIFSRPFNGALFETWVEGMPPADLARIERAIQAGVVEGRTTQQIVRDIVSGEGALEGSRRGAEAVARTALNHVATQAREEVYRANEDLVREVRWVSTLDGRTTFLCASRDGRTFPVREGPRPPAHWRCRSTTIPVIDGVRLVGDRPTVRDTRDRRNREIDFRAEAKAKAGDAWKDMTEKERGAAVTRIREKWARENIGSVAKGVSYEDWLRRQPTSFQDEVLGPARGRLFRDGGLTVGSFVDASGRTLTLDELRKAEASAFKKAQL